MQLSSDQNVGFATPKHHATEGRTRPSAYRHTMPLRGGRLRLPVPNLAFWNDQKLAPNFGPFQRTKPKLQPSSVQNVGFTTPKHRDTLHHTETPWYHAREGRTRSSAWGCLCLASLSEPTKNKLQILDPSSLQNAAFATPKHHVTEAFWTACLLLVLPNRVLPLFLRGCLQTFSPCANILSLQICK